MSSLRHGGPGRFGVSALALAARPGCGAREPLSIVKGTSPDARRRRAMPQLASLPGDVQGGAVSRLNESGVVTGTAASDGYNILTTSVSLNVISPWATESSRRSIPRRARPAILIYHNPHLSSRISHLQSVTPLPGSIVQQGSLIGTSTLQSVSLIGAIHFTVYHDSVISCPLSFLTPAAQTIVANRLGGGLSSCL